MRIDAPSRADVLAVARSLRPADLAELVAANHGYEADAIPELMADRYGDTDVALGAWLGDTPVAIGAVVPIGAEVAQIGMFATNDFPKIALGMTRFVRNRLLPLYEARGFRRIECASVEGYDEAHRWIETLGLQRADTLAGFGAGGEDFIRFVRHAHVEG